MKTSHKLLLFFCLLVWSPFAKAQPTRLWQRNYAYPGYVRDNLIRLSPSRILGIGSLDLPGDTTKYSACLRFYNNQGDTVRVISHRRSQRVTSQQLFPPYYAYGDAARTRNGEFLIAGRRSNGRVNGVAIPEGSFMTRVDSLGNIRWTQYFSFNGQPAGGYLIGTPDDGGIVVGAIVRQVSGPIFASIAIASRLDSLGNVSWQRTIGRPYSIVKRTATLPDGSYVLAGNEQRLMPGTGYVREDGWLIRLKANGDTLGTRYFGTPTQYEQWEDVRPAPHNGLLLAGNVGTGSTMVQGWLMQLDSLGQVAWQQRVPAAFTSTTPNCVFQHGRPLQGGEVLVSGYQLVPGDPDQPQATYQAVFRPNASGGATAVWERITPISANEPSNGSLDLSAAGEVTINGYTYSGPTQYDSHSLLRLQLAERPYQPNLCQTPPQALLGFAPTPAADSLRFVSLSTPGPQYAQLLRWRWDFGDGTFFDGPTPPPHHFPPGSPAATAVRLTVTNNLGCASTALAFPLALATAPQRALQARLSLFPNPTGPAGPGPTVRLPGLRPQPPVPTELCNALGQSLWRGRWPVAALAQGAPLDLTGLPPGVYALRLRPQEGALVKRLVVQ